jgi:hypothetical protein
LIAAPAAALNLFSLSGDSVTLNRLLPDGSL